MSHAFISYVSEDMAIADYFEEILKKNGIKIWRDTNNLGAGARWKDHILEGIRAGGYFLPLFTKKWLQRERTYANEELAIAIEELRMRPRDNVWFIPIRVDDCQIPDRPIGGGERMSDIQRVDIGLLGWGKGLTKLLTALGVENPVLETGEPLADGLSSHVEIESGGRMIIQNSEPRIPVMLGASYQITGGWCGRTKENDILAHLSTFAPNANWQKVNDLLNLSSFYIISKDKYISFDKKIPTNFANRFENVLPAGAEIYDLASGTFVQLAVNLPVRSEYTAQGTASGDGNFRGVFSIKLTYFLPTGPVPVNVSGEFDLRFRKAVGRPSIASIDLNSPGRPWA